MSFLKRIEEKPSHVKSQIAFAVAVLITGVIAVVWATTIPARLGSLSAKTGDVDTSQTASLSDSFTNFMNTVESESDSLTKPNNEVVTEPEVTGGISPGSAFQGLADWRTSTTTASGSTTPPTPAVDTSPSERAPTITAGTSTMGGGVAGNTGGRTILIGTSTKSTTTKTTQ